MAITRWIFDLGGGGQYTFERNPDRTGGDSGWVWEQRNQEMDVLGSTVPTIQVDGLRGARRTLKFTAITGTMKRTLEAYYKACAEIENCRDHLYATNLDNFSCLILEFSAPFHPVTGSFPGSGEDTYDLTIVLMRTTA